MKTLITCGSPWCQLTQIQTAFVQGGLEQARLAQSGSVNGIATWHDRLFSGRNELLEPVNPGKVWELAASEIFLANWDRRAWGWADSRSTWLLEFWRDFDSSTRFVLVYTPAYDVIRRVLTHESGDAPDIKATLENWSLYQAEFLRFFHRNRSRCVFVHSQDALRQSKVWLGAINEILGLDLLNAQPNNAVNQTTDPLLHMMVQSLLEKYPAVRALEEEIRATLPADAGIAPDKTVNVEAASEILWMLNRKESQLLSTVDDQCQRILAIEREANAFTAERGNFLEKISLLQIQHEEQSHRQRDVIAELTECNLQRTAIAEELGRLKLDYENLANETKKSLDSQQAEFKIKEKLFHTDEEQGKKAFAEERDQAIKQVNQLKQEQKILMQERDQWIKQVNQLKQEQRILIEEREKITKKMGSLKSEFGQENDLLVRQLQQIQEELEHYFLQNQESSAKNRNLENRLQAFLAKYPDHVEWDKIEVISDAGPLHCKISGLQVAGRDVSLLDISIDPLDKKPVICLTPASAVGDQPLLYWPSAIDDLNQGQKSSLKLDFDSDVYSNEAALIRALTPSDVHLLRGACTVLVEALPATVSDRSSWVERINLVHNRLQHLPPTWRYDQVELKHQQVNPDYEALSFILTNARFGSRSWPLFEFRFSAANVRKGKFSQFPKLEFPMPTEGDRQFENWFEESEDDRGVKFELRFDIKNRAMDVALWSALSPGDQAQAISLIEQLPGLLRRVQLGANVKIARPWTDWQNFAFGLQQALLSSLGLKDLLGYMK